MNARRLIVVIVLFFLLFLGVYTWNERTGKMDTISTSVGLEVTGFVLRSVTFIQSSITSFWENYLYLVNTQAENNVLRKEISQLKRDLAIAKEDSAELYRLRNLINIEYKPEWKTVGVRILAWRLGANDFFDSFLLSKGFFSGAKVGTPIIDARGLVGRVLKAGPYTSVALLLTDSGSSVAVLSEKGRVSGILQGNGHNKLLSMRFVKQNEKIAVGELLLTSGLDLSFPKGIPVGKVVSVKYGKNSMLDIQVEALVTFDKLEEVLLLQNPFEHILPEGSPVYSPRPNQIFSPIPIELTVEETPKDENIEKAFKEQSESLDEKNTVNEENQANGA